MTNIKPLSRFIGEELPEYYARKDEPDQWYVLIGSLEGGYSVWADYEIEEDYQESQAALPPEDRDANPPIEGFVQIGTNAWTSDAFDFGGEDEKGFVQEMLAGDTIDRALLPILVVHESVLSEKALAVADGEEVEA